MTTEIAVLRRLLAAFVLGVVLLIPFLVTPIPPVLDFPDHVAEIYVMAQLPADPVLARVYAIHWSVVPNSGVELVMPFLLNWLPLWTTGKLFLGLALLLPLVGAALFSRASFGRWSAWPLAGGLVAYNTLFLLGFMNFLIGLGLALCTAAFWVAARTRFPAWTILAAIPAAIVLFFVHMFGLVYFAMLIGAHELASLAGPPGQRWPGFGAVLRRLLPDALVFVLPAALLLASPLAEASGPTLRLSLKVKLGELFYPFLTYWQTPGRLVALALLAIMAGLLIRRRARVSVAAVIVVLVLLAVWPFLPHVLKGTGYIDSRLPIMIGFLLFAGFVPRDVPRRLGLALALVIAVAIVTRIGFITAVWAGHNQDLAELHQVIDHIPAGSQVLAVDVPMEQVIPVWLARRRNWMIAAYQKTYYHDAALVIPERHAFWPRLFTGLGKQPVVVNPAYADRTAPEGELPDYHELMADTPSAAALADAPYLQDWQNKFHYVLLLAAGAAVDLSRLPPDRLELVDQTEFATLFRIRRVAAK